MIGEIPASTNPALSVRDPYRIKVVNVDAADCDIPYGVGEVCDWAVDDPTPWVCQPTEDSLPAPRCVLFPGSEIPCSDSEGDPEDYTLIEAADFSLDTKAVLARLDADSAAPTLGCTVGTKAGSWGLTVGNTGFVVTGIVNDVAGEYVVYVRPFASAGAAFDPVFAVISSAIQYDTDIYYPGNGGRVYNSRGVYTLHAQADIETEPDYNYGFASAPNGAGFAMREGVGVLPFVYSTLGAYHNRSVYWTGLDIGAGVETPFPAPFESSTGLKGLYTPFILADGIPRAVLCDGAATDTPQAMELSTHGGTITGALATKAATTQTVGTATLTVTTAATGGALDLKDGNDLLVGTGANQRRYTVTADTAEATENTDVVIPISPNLEIELTGGEAVVITPSWATVFTSDYANWSDGGSSCNKRGFPQSKYVVLASPTATASDTYQVARSMLYFNGSTWAHLLNVTYTHDTYTYCGSTFTDVAVTSDGEVWAIGSVVRSWGGSTEYGLFRYDAGSWTRITVPMPSGYTVHDNGLGQLVYLPDGRLVMSAQMTKSDDGSAQYCAFYVLDSSSPPAIIKGSEGNIILRGKDAPAYQVLKGCAATGNELYLFWVGRGIYQYLDLATDEFVLIPPGALYSLKGSTATGVITGTLLTKAATTQTVGTGTLTVTTAATTGAVDFKVGNWLKVGTGANARTYEVTSDVAEGDPATDVVIAISPNLEVELTGGEAVALVNGWASRIAPVVDNAGETLYCASPQSNFLNLR